MNWTQAVSLPRGDAWTKRPIIWNQARRNAVLAAIQQVCAHRGVRLLAAHVRTTHVHIVVEASVLNRMELDGPERKRWTRHGSIRWLWKPQHISAAIQYVVSEQGEAMAVFQSDEV